MKWQCISVRLRWKEQYSCLNNQELKQVYHLISDYRSSECASHVAMVTRTTIVNLEVEKRELFQHALCSLQSNCLGPTLFALSTAAKNFDSHAKIMSIVYCHHGDEWQRQNNDTAASVSIPIRRSISGLWRSASHRRPTVGVGLVPSNIYCRLEDT